MKKRPKDTKKASTSKFQPKKREDFKKDGPRKSFSKNAAKKRFHVVRKDGSAIKPNKKDDGLMRLNRFISHSGICSRREADELITAGIIKVNGKVVTEMGVKVNPLTDKIHFEDQLLRGEKLKYLLINKPKGFISKVDDPRKKKTVLDLMGSACKERISPVGGIDRTTTGLLLMTNDESLTKKLTHSVNGAKKVYSISLDKEVTIGQLRKLREGIPIEGGTIKVDKVDYTGRGKGKRDIGVEIHMGNNRDLRRMFIELGLEVMKMDRVMYAGLTKKNLPKGNWRFLTAKEIEFLKML